MPDMTRQIGGLTMRCGVGLLLANDHGEVLVGLRADSDPPQWQYPQGGREADSRFLLEDAYRELQEELGVASDEVDWLTTFSEETFYSLPKEFRKRGFAGQFHQWVVFRYLKPGLPDLRRATDREFTKLAWQPVDWVVEHTAPFRVEPYKQVVRMWHRAGYPIPA